MYVTEIITKKKKQPPEPRLFSAVLVQASWTNIFLQHATQILHAIKSYCKFWLFRRTVSSHSCLKICHREKVGVWLLLINPIQTDSEDVLRRHICTIWLWY